MKSSVSRRSALKCSILGAGAVALGAAAGSLSAQEVAPLKLKGRIHQSVSQWCFGKMPPDTLYKAAKALGLEGIDLLGPNQWAALKKYDLVCTMASGAAGIPKGFNRIENHDKLVESYEAMIPKVAEAGIQNLICFSGNREGLPDEKGIENCVIGLKRLMALAEAKKVTLVMELLNSKQHKDYQCDHTAWGVEICKRVGSERFKLLYDIYHMQMMEGDLIATIKANHKYIAHYHTGGVPGRGDLTVDQEINYPAVMKAIVDTGFKGYVAHEFLPKKPNPLDSLRQAVELCDV